MINAINYKMLETTLGTSGQNVLRELKGKNRRDSESNYFSQAGNSKPQDSLLTKM